MQYLQKIYVAVAFTGLILGGEGGRGGSLTPMSPERVCRRKGSFLAINLRKNGGKILYFKSVIFKKV